MVSSGDYTFLNDSSSIPIIYAEGSTTTLAYHSTNPHAAQTLTRTVLGVPDFSLNASSIYPNPSKGDFTVITKTNLKMINIYSQTGVFITSIKVDATDSKNLEVNAKGLSKGIYLIELQNESDKTWKKVIID